MNDKSSPFSRTSGLWPFRLATLFALLPVGAGPDGASEGSAIRQLVLSTLFVAAGFTLARFPTRWRMLRDALPISLVLLLIYLGLSVMWSASPWVSFKRYAQILGVVVVGAALMIGSNGNARLHRLMPPVLLVAMISTILYTSAFPGWAISEMGLRGFMATKNNFGQLAVLCVLFPLALMALDRNTSRKTWLLLAALGVIGLAASSSATSAMALGVVGALYLLFEMQNLHWSWRAALLAMVMASAAAAFSTGVILGFPSPADALSEAFKLAGRDATLTGRTYLWELMAHEISRHPWFGTGFGGFWLGLEGASGQIAYAIKWGYPGQAHNGYLDIINELGIVGSLFMILLLLEHAKAIAQVIKTDRSLGLFHFALMALVLVTNIAEATLLRTTHLYWIIFVVSVIEVRRLARAAHHSVPVPGEMSILTSR